MNLCKDCKHFRQDNTGRCSPSACVHPEIAPPTPVYGTPLHVGAWDAREAEDLCGKEGKRFERRPEPPPIRFRSSEPVRRRWWSWL